ncbi:peptide chain release factor N(5)-glutamine methyltransferase [Roseococcus sp. DSY-14]|uniref:peptide chain release factor N(5)-glutamine methyltransferase n=1 Tax=Roseococcus sp. DSY-14 TaxID=3369650 RepID=UPI00387AAF54
MTVGGLLCEGGAALRAAGIEGARQEARLLLAHALQCPQEALLRDPRAPVPPEVAATFRALLARRTAREPLALLTGIAGFWTLELEVSGATLLPRPDSEALIRLAGTLAPDARRMLDLGTGTGCLLLAALAERPAAWGLGLDLRPEAAALARRNAARNGLAARAAFAAGDWDAPLAGRFDLVLSNPPYIPSADVPGLMPEVARHEPATALDGGPDGLDAYRRILPALHRLLAPGGVAVLEIGWDQEPALQALAAAHGLAPRGREGDFGGNPRAIALAPIGGGGGAS